MRRQRPIPMAVRRKIALRKYNKKFEKKLLCPCLPDDEGSEHNSNSKTRRPFALGQTIGRTPTHPDKLHLRSPTTRTRTETRADAAADAMTLPAASRSRSPISCAGAGTPCRAV